ncbi:MAG: alpha/beta hydrolase [Akkermansiaceae bacterium]|nr:alpha/beta hydrolase [Armatimonadota bacterium]
MKMNAFPTALAAVFAAGTVLAAQPLTTDARIAKPDIVLVHGAYADGSSWGRVIPLLQAKGYHVVSVQNPTTSLADDVLATDRVVNQQKGPVVLVGHSWAGVVITQAGNNPRVKALVYVDASAPDSGQSIIDAASAFPPEPGAGAGVKDDNGFLTLPDAAVRQYFAQDLSPADQGLIASVQTPWYVGCLTDKVTHAAWHEKPSWWVIGENDHMINPKLQEKMAATIKAKVTKLPTSHLAMLADPKSVTAVIVAAATEVQSGNISNEISLPAPAVPVAPLSPVQSATAAPTALAIKGPAALVPVLGEAPVKIIIDPPLPDSLAHGRVVIQYRAENLRIEPVFGVAALAVSPRIGHIHVTVDDAPWHWLDASGEPLVLTGLPAGSHKVLIELVNASHQTLDYGVVRFAVPHRFLTPNDPKADGFRSAPDFAADTAIRAEEDPKEPLP